MEVFLTLVGPIITVLAGYFIFQIFGKNTGYGAQEYHHHDHHYNVTVPTQVFIGTAPTEEKKSYPAKSPAILTGSTTRKLDV